MKLNQIFAVALPIAALALYYIVDQKDLDGGFNRDVISVDLVTGKLNPVSTLERPVITSANIAVGLKYNLVKLLSYKLEDISSHIDDVSYMFNDDYFNSYKKQIRADANELLNSDVRVVDFIIIDGPFYLGSKLSNARNWDYYVEGYFTNKGNFSGGAAFAKTKLKVSLVESRTRNGNPSGVEIYEIKRF